MLIDAAHAEETRVVVVDGSRIEELDFESQSRKQLRGNIYLAKVTRVEPSLQAAFIEYGGNRHGFLAFNEIHPDYYQIPVADREALMREEAEEEAQHVPSDDADADDEDEMDEAVERRRRRLMRRYKIQEVIKRRQIMLVQVVKEERGNKGAALTTYLSLAGRYCVLMPNTARGGGISRKITSATDRKRLKSAVQSLDVPPGMGLIIRTAGAARTKLEIKRDYEYLMRLWEDIREKTLQSIAPALIYEEEDLVKRAIRDMFDKDLESIQVEGDAGYREARDFMRMIMPSQAKKVVHYRDPTPLFVKHRIEDQISQIHSPVVQLKSGGYLVINQTEALVAIDVNSGRSTRERNIETTALKTNIEAAEEAARQLRLRDLAGLIVIDFIDMDEAKNNRAVEKALKDALKDDRARLQMGKISSFGLMEISRQRRRTGVLEGSTHVCEHCQGMGRVRSVESSAVAALRSIEMESVKGGGGAITVRLPTAVGLYILNEKRAYLAALDQTHDLHVTIAIDDRLAAAEVEIERTETREGPPRERVAPAAEPEADWIPPQDLDEEDAEGPDVGEAVAEEAGAEAGVEQGADGGSDGRGRRRRRRRGGRRDEELQDRPRVSVEAGQSVSEDEDAEADDGEAEDGEEARPGAEEDGGQRRRRRRRGRRGGRRLREEPRGDDVYAWSVPAREPRGPDDRPSDPYIWRDPHTRPAEALVSPQPEADAAAAAEESAAPQPTAPLPAEEAAPQERKRPRSRRRTRAEAVAEDGAVVATGETAPAAAAEDAPAAVAVLEGVSEALVAASAPEPTLSAPAAETLGTEAPAPTAKPRRSRAKKVVPADTTTQALEASLPMEPPAPLAAAGAAEPATLAEPELEPVPEPARALERDPAEISAPPAEPRRGWWRRLV